MVIVAAGCGGLGSSGNDLDVTDGGNQALQCTAPLACPAPSSGTKQTICGQLFDLENGARFGDTSVGTACTPNATSGPCSLVVTPYDAIAFGQNPVGTVPLAHDALYIDSCGRYRIENIDVNGVGPFLALSVDDAAGPGPAGTTVQTAVVTRTYPGAATGQLEAWVASSATTTQWTATGGPALADGVFVPVFRAHMLGTPNTDPFEPQSGVTVMRNDNPVSQYYFDAASIERTTIDPAAVTTGANGTALIANAMIAESLAYSGMGGLADPTNCRWPSQVGMALPNIVFVEIFRPTNLIPNQCSL
jgi:hypothetical protein